MSDKSKSAELQDIQRNHRAELSNPSISLDQHARTTKQIKDIERQVQPVQDPFTGVKAEPETQASSLFEYDPAADITRGPRKI